MWTIHAARVKFCQNDRCNAYMDHGGNSGWLGKHGSKLVLSQVASEHPPLTGQKHHHGVSVDSPRAIPVHAHVYETFRTVDLADAGERVVPSLADIARCAILLSVNAVSNYARKSYEDLDINTLQRLGAQCLLDADIICNYTVIPPPTDDRDELQAWNQNQNVNRMHRYDGRGLMNLHKLSALTIGMMKMTEWRLVFAAHLRRHGITNLTQRFALALATQHEARPTQYFAYRNQVRKCLRAERTRLLRHYEDAPTSDIVTYCVKSTAEQFDRFCTAYEHLMNYRQIDVPSTVKTTASDTANLTAPCSYQPSYCWSHNRWDKSCCGSPERTRALVPSNIDLYFCNFVTEQTRLISHRLRTSVNYWLLHVEIQYETRGSMVFVRGSEKRDRVLRTTTSQFDAIVNVDFGADPPQDIPIIGSRANGPGGLPLRKRKSSVSDEEALIE